MMEPNLVTLDGDERSRDALALMVLQAASKRPTPYGRAALAGHQEYKARIDAGESHTAAMEAARTAMYEALPGRR